MRILLTCLASREETALLAPVAQALSRQYAKLSLCLVLRRDCEYFFHNIPGVHTIAVGIGKGYAGFQEISSLYKELCKLGPFSKALDLSPSFQSRLLRFRFFFKGLFFSNIQSQKLQEWSLIRRRAKRKRPLKHLTERYFQSFKRLGYEVKEKGKGPWLNPDTKARARAYSFLKKLKKTRKQNMWIALAPFPFYPQRKWPLAKWGELIKTMQMEMQCSFFLFGKTETEDPSELDRFCSNYPQLIPTGLLLHDAAEIALLERMDLLLSVNSFYMHLASLLGIRLVFLWGPTHVHAGYGPYQSHIDHSHSEREAFIEISTSSLSCRPCSLHGEKACLRKDRACMEWISSAEVLGKVRSLCHDIAFQRGKTSKLWHHSKVSEQ